MHARIAQVSTGDRYSIYASFGANPYPALGLSYVKLGNPTTGLGPVTFCLSADALR